MKLDGAVRFTLRYLFRGDTLLNWLLGVVLVFFPAPVDHVVGQAALLPLLLYRVIGAGFVAFAAWQTVILVRQRIGPPALVFAALMAEIPVVGLTVALVFMNLALRPGWRVILWIGNGYMLLLGVWYFFLARRLAVRDTGASAEP